MAPQPVVTRHHSPRSYIVESGGHLFRRNREHLAPATQAANGPDIPEPELDAMSTDGEAQDSTSYRPDNEQHHPRMESQTTSPPSNAYVTRHGRVVKPPKKLDL